MARPRLDRPVLGKPVSAFPVAYRRDGKVVCYYLRFRDEKGQEHSAGRIDTTSRAAARRYCMEWLAGMRVGRIYVQGTRDAIEKFLETLPNTDTRRIYRERIGDLAGYLQWKDIRDWTFSDLEAYLKARRKGQGERKDGRRRKPWTAVTVKTHRTSLQTFATWLFDHDICDHDWGYDAKGKRYQGERVQDKDVRWIHKEDYFRLRDAIRSPDDFFPLPIQQRGREVRFCATAARRGRLQRLEPAVELASLGLRLHEIQVLRRFRIDRRARQVAIQTPKTYSTRKIRLTKDLDEIFGRHGVYAEARGGHVMDAAFRDRSEERTNYDTALLRSASDALGIFDNAGQPVTWHTLRKSCGVWMAQAGNVEATIGAYLGHAPDSPMPRRYMAAIGDEALLDAVDESRKV